ncbi:MAG: hypothetical protein WDZ59_11740 [Pirellulales bacterium]
MRGTVGSVTAAAAVILAVMAMWPQQHGLLSTPTAVAQESVANQDVIQALGQPANTPGNPVLDDAARNAKVMKALSGPAIADFIESPLVEVLSFLEHQHGVQFYLDIHAVPRDAPVTNDLRDVSLETLLDFMLRDLNLTYVVRGGVIVVTSRDEAEEMLEVRVYDVGDIIANYEAGVAAPQQQRPENPARQLAPAGAENAFAEPAGGGGFGAAGGRAPENVAMNNLIDLVATAIEPDGWQENGGLGTIRSFQSALVVTQSEPVQRKVQDLLEGLRGVSRNRADSGGAPSGLGSSQPPAATGAETAPRGAPAAGANEATQPPASPF